VTSWLFREHGGVESETPEHKFFQWQGGKL